jgi:hypothetical protein
VDVTEVDIEGLPAEHVRVGRAAFGAVWVAAERLYDGQVRAHVADWYAYGVVSTCRWLARATMRREVGPWELARSPVTGRLARATPELIEEEFVAAQVLAMRRPVPAWVAARPGWVEGIVATFDWAWRRSAVPPVPVDTDTAQAGA